MRGQLLGSAEFFLLRKLLFPVYCLLLLLPSGRDQVFVDGCLAVSLLPGPLVAVAVRLAHGNWLVRHTLIGSENFTTDIEIIVLILRRL